MDETMVRNAFCKMLQNFKDQGLDVDNMSKKQLDKLTKLVTEHCGREDFSQPEFTEKILDLFGKKAANNEKQEPRVNTSKIKRNDPCTCNSGKKYKNCCLNVTSEG